MPPEQNAEVLARELKGMDHVFVVSPPGEPRVRLHVLPCCRNDFVGDIANLGFAARFVSLRPHVLPDGSMPLAEVYEIDTAARSAPPPDLRLVADERSPSEITRERIEELTELLKRLGAKQ